jgi:hypothetical protein
VRFLSQDLFNTLNGFFDAVELILGASGYSFDTAPSGKPRSGAQNAQR